MKIFVFALLAVLAITWQASMANQKEVLVTVFLCCCVVQWPTAMFACSVKCTNSTREGNIRISLRNTTSRRVVKLYCRTGYYFIVKGNGKVKGSQRDNDTKKYGLFELQPLGGPMIAMKNIQTQRYVAISNRGRVYTVLNTTKETSLTEFSKGIYFRSFSSQHSSGTNLTWSLVIKQNGRVKAFANLRKNRRSSQFLLIE